MRICFCNPVQINEEAMTTKITFSTTVYFVNYPISLVLTAIKKSRENKHID